MGISKVAPRRGFVLEHPRQTRGRRRIKTMAVYRDRPSPIVDNQGGGGPSRAGRYSEAYAAPLTNKEFYSADEGSYFWAGSVPGTPIIGPVDDASVATATKGLLTVYNGGTNRIYPQLLQLFVTTAGAADTNVVMTPALDAGNRYSSGGTALTSVNVNMDSVFTTAATITFGALTTSAASSTVRYLRGSRFRGTIGIVGDMYEMTFGALGSPSAAGSLVATLAVRTLAFPPVVIGPLQSLVIHDFSASISTGRTYSVGFGYIER